MAGTFAYVSGRPNMVACLALCCASWHCRYATTLGHLRHKQMVKLSVIGVKKLQKDKRDLI